MDWSKAKIILIWAFLFLDLFLGFQIYSSRTEQWLDTKAFESDKWDIELYLKQQNIRLEAEVPQETPEMKYLNVKYMAMDALSLQDITGVNVTQEKSAIYAQVIPPIQIHEQTTTEELLRQIAKRVPHADEYMPDAVTTSKDQLVYLQLHEKRPLFVAPLDVFVQNGLVKSYRQTYLHIRSQGSGRAVVSAYTALRSLVEKEMIRPGDQVVNVMLGYYGYHYDADIQVLAPVWRFVTQGGKTHYINAFTGAVERPLDVMKSVNN